jgi:imidazolonepropionase
MNTKTLIFNIGILYTPVKVSRGKDMNSVSEIHNAFIVIKDDIIDFVGSGDYSTFLEKDMITYDAKNNIAIPGLIDSHTHLVHYGSRENEFSKKIEGVPYLDILKSGGGILNTVKTTRDASMEELYNYSYKSLSKMLNYGVTTIESKSGYGLNLETEIKQLNVNKLLDKNNPIDIHSTYLGAHAIPTEFKNKKAEYINTLLQDLEVIKDQDLAEFVDIFCEDSVFNKEDSHRILSRAKELGFKLKIHADEIVSLGGANLAVSLNASSADHLMAISDHDIELISKSNVVANLLPSTSFYLNKDYAPARKLIESGAIVSISSDYNPGSSPSENFQFSMQLAANKLRMTPNEVLTASTINPAYSLGISDKVGTLEVGKKADIVIMEAFNFEYVLYHFATNHTRAVFKNGKQVV